MVHRALQGEVVLLDLASGKYFGLNATGAAAWEALGPHGCSLDTLVETLVAQFEVDPSELRRDLESLVAALAQAGLVRLGP